jgi:hypothetical protein
MGLFAKVRTHTSAGLALLLLFTAAGIAPAQQEWGSIKGKVIFGGAKIPIPDEMALLAKSDDRKICLCDKKEMLSEMWIVDPKTKGIKSVCVYLMLDSRDERDLTKPIPIHPNLKKPKPEFVEVDQPCCQFKPVLIAMQEGQKLRVKNSMSIQHNVKIDGDQDVFNPAINVLIPPMKEIETTAWKAQWKPAPMQCSLHGWMKASIRVFSHPYYFVTQENGEFEFKDAPAGKYRLVIYHPDMGHVVGDKTRDKFGIQIEIKPGPSDKPTDLGTFKVIPPTEEKAEQKN